MPDNRGEPDAAAGLMAKPQHRLGTIATFGGALLIEANDSEFVPMLLALWR